MSYFSTKRTIFPVYSNRCYEEFEKIDKYLQILEKSGIGEIIEKEQNKSLTSQAGRKEYNPFNLMAAVVYCFAMVDGTLRDIEESCIFDLRVMYIMENNMPSYAVIGDFINRYILPYKYEIFTKVTLTIIAEFNIDIYNQYLDGTKIEANANKYKFVWKPTTFHKKLDEKIKKLLEEINHEFTNKDLIKSYQLNSILKEYAYEENIDIYNIPSRKGIRLTLQQKNYNLGYKYLLKLLEYEEKEEICGDNRNSYYKTDHDATAMALKTDYYSGHGSNMHAAYNFQAIVSSGLILMFGVFQDRADYYTFTPMLDLYYKYYNKYPVNFCADSGYGIYINYKYLRDKGIGNYVKFQQWNGESSGKRPQIFHVIDNQVLCLNAVIGKEVAFNNTIHQRNKDGKLYKFIGCNKCNYSYKCKENLKDKTKDYRYIELITDYENLKEEARKNLLSPDGIEIRINRSIQIEGTFGQIKQNMGYVRIRRRGIEKVSCEIMLMCLGRNIRKVFSIFSGNKFKESYWDRPRNLRKEKFPIVKPKSIKKTVRKLI